MNMRASRQSLAPLRARWNAMAPREQNMTLLAGGVVALALLWWVALAPALHSLRTAPERHAQADRQLRQMQLLQAEAEQLRGNARPVVGDAKALLQSSLSAELGASAQLNWMGDRAQITLKAAPAAALARWLAQVRSNTHAVPAEMKLARSASASTAAASGAAGAGAADAVRWDGSLVLDLPVDPSRAP
ncbi:type II secretion system protein GspM [Delftia sp. NA_296.1]|uniref:type II secretion system protein GspM n=1 Tax=Delftia TaxID=80865 RepID=UPI000BCAB462|nr:type II secretion system protein GspM [Delftia acidovorans]SOE34244.1 general secretion pathway protein M [Delftia acidovorans]